VPSRVGPAISNGWKYDPSFITGLSPACLNVFAM